MEVQVLNSMTVTPLVLFLMMAAATTMFSARSSPALETYEISYLSPYKECTESCYKCGCTKIWPPDLSLCVCLDSIDPGSEKGREKSESMPYKECIQSCESETACACTLIYPTQLSKCICLQPKQQGK